MKRFLFMSALLVTTMTASAQLNARYCMTYNDFVENRWTAIDSLVEGRTKQLCQMKFEDDQYKFKTGDKEADKVLKKSALAVEYGGHLYVNCKNLRVKDVPLDVSNYAQAYRYGDNKILVVAHWINTAAVLAGVAGDIVSAVAPTAIALPSAVGSTAIWVSMDKLNSYRCYILDSEADAKGKTAVTRIDDEVMAQILKDDSALLERYKAVSNKKNRQSAANILPVLMEKQLIKE